MANKPEQTEMFPELAEVEIHASSGNKWWYIVSPGNLRMFSGLTDDGEMLMVEHELQNIVPHLYTSPSTAKRFLQARKLPYHVKRYPYTVRWWAK